MWIDWIAALSPILVLLLVMVRFHWSASRAGPLGWFAAVTVAFLRFGVDFDILAWTQAKAFFLALDVLLIVWGAFFLYRVVAEAGGILLLRDSLANLSTDPCMQGLLIAWAFASFLQGVGGFGVPVAVAAPLLVGLGFSPLTAVVAPSIGHAWAVTFGSLASSFQALVAASGVEGNLLAPMCALFLAAAGYGCGVSVAAVIGGWKGVQRMAFPILVMGTAMGGAQYLVVTNGFWSLGGLSAGLAGMLSGLILVRFYKGPRMATASSASRTGGGAYFPYIFLIVITLMLQFVPVLRDWFGSVVVRAPFPALETGRGFITLAEESKHIVLFRHAGMILLYTAVLAYSTYIWKGTMKPGAMRVIVRETLRNVLPSSIGIAAMVSMAVLMANSGMTQALAEGLAALAGVLFPAVAVWIGALGAFITGSNTNSNVIFAWLQRSTAEILAMPVAVILAAQTAGAALGSIVSPTKIVVGASTTGMRGHEGEVLRALLRSMSLLLVVLSFIVLAVVYL